VGVSLVGWRNGSKRLVELEQDFIITVRDGKVPGCSFFILYANAYPGGCRRLASSFD